MRNYTRFLLPSAVAAALFLGPDLVHASPDQDVNIVSPLTSNGSVAVEATIKGVVRTRANPALTHVGVLASDVVTLSLDFSGVLSQIRSDGSSSTFTTVPAGRALVITDCEYQAFGGTPGDAMSFSLALFASPFTRTMYLVGDKFDENGIASGKGSMTAGITFGPGTSPQLRFGGVPTNGSEMAFAHGYYVDVP